MYGRPVLYTAPTSEPLDVEEVNRHLRTSDEDEIVTGLITTARLSAERYLNRSLITQTWKAYFDDWCDEMLLPFPRLQSVTSVEYYNTSGVLTTLSESSYYWVVKTTEPGKIVKKYSAVYPDVQEGRPDAIIVTYVSGYGNAGQVPDDIKHAMKVLIADYYEHRGSVVIGQVNKIPNHVSDLLHPHKIYEF